jgi:hypothetical protein
MFTEWEVRVRVGNAIFETRVMADGHRCAKRYAERQIGTRLPHLRNCPHATRAKRVTQSENVQEGSG